MDNSYLAAQFDYMQRLLARLEIMLLKPHVSYAHVYQVPPTKIEDENKPVAQIHANSFMRTDAVKKAIQAYKDLHLIRGLSQKNSRQTFGMLYLPTTSSGNHQHLDDMICTVSEINNCKNNIRTFLTENYATRSERFNALKQQCPATMTLHVYRNIKMHVNENIKSANFTWVTQDDLRRTSAKEIISQINELIENSDSSGYIDAMLALASTISKIPDSKLRLRRAISRPQPCVNMTYSDGKKPTMNHVPMPIIIIQQNLPYSKPAKLTWEKKTDRKTRSDRLKTQTLAKLNGFNIEVLQD